MLCPSWFACSVIQTDTVADARGLTQVNEIYERYVPGSWTKPTPDADQVQRNQWILAKYKHRHARLI